MQCNPILERRAGGKRPWSHFLLAGGEIWEKKREGRKKEIENSGMEDQMVDRSAQSFLFS